MDRRAMTVASVVVGVASLACSGTAPHGPSPASLWRPPTTDELTALEHDDARAASTCSAGHPQPEARPVTLQDLEDSPEQYLDVLVRVRAVAFLKFERESLIASNGTRGSMSADGAGAGARIASVRLTASSEAPPACDMRLVDAEGRLYRGHGRGGDMLVFHVESMTSAQVTLRAQPRREP